MCFIFTGTFWRSWSTQTLLGHMGHFLEPSSECAQTMTTLLTEHSNLSLRTLHPDSTTATMCPTRPAGAQTLAQGGASEDQGFQGQLPGGDGGRPSKPSGGVSMADPG